MHIAPTVCGADSRAQKTQCTQTEPLELVTVKDVPRIDSRVLAASLGNKHRPTVALIDKYREPLETFGHLSFKKADGARKQGGGRAERVAFLTEDQALFLLALSRNTDRVVALKVRLIQAFGVARRNAQQRLEDYLPGNRLLHDTIQQKCSGSSNARIVHMNFNKLINRAVGIESGQRGRAPVSALAIAQQIVTAALAGAVDHHDGYKQAKINLGMYQCLLHGHAGGLPNGTT